MVTNDQNTLTEIVYQNKRNTWIIYLKKRDIYNLSEHFIFEKTNMLIINIVQILLRVIIESAIYISLPNSTAIPP